MKKNIVSILLVLCSQLVFSQRDTNANKKMPAIKPTPINHEHIIPGSKAILIRKEVVRLNLQLTQLSDSVAIIKKGIYEQVKKMKDPKESKSEMGEMESLRLQMAMDRLSKMMSTLSNLLKKISDTAQEVTQNIK